MKSICGRVAQVAAVLLTTAAFAAADSTNMPPPGTLNYVEGQVLVQGQRQSPQDVGNTYLEANQELQTRDGNAEILLTPGVYLRVGHHSTVKMISPALENTEVELTRGSALLEVDELFKENDLRVRVGDATTRIEKEGLYGFNADHPSVEVLEGKAVAFEGDRKATLKKGHEALFAEAKSPVRRKFDIQAAEDDPLYRWSTLRGEYATKSNVQVANNLWSYGGWWGPGWYWDPFWSDFAFMPGAGIWWDPFGFPFFSPGYIGWAPYYGFGGGFVVINNTPPKIRGPREMPRLARTPAPGTPGFRPLPKRVARGGMGMPRGSGHGGVFGGGGGMAGGGSGGGGGVHVGGARGGGARH